MIRRDWVAEQKKCRARAYALCVRVLGMGRQQGRRQTMTTCLTPTPWVPPSTWTPSPGTIARNDLGWVTTLARTESIYTYYEKILSWRVVWVGAEERMTVGFQLYIGFRIFSLIYKKARKKTNARHDDGWHRLSAYDEFSKIRTREAITKCCIIGLKIWKGRGRKNDGFDRNVWFENNAYILFVEMRFIEFSRLFFFPHSKWVYVLYFDFFFFITIIMFRDYNKRACYLRCRPTAIFIVHNYYDCLCIYK
jgi:hypothetical protein